MVGFDSWTLFLPPVFTFLPPEEPTRETPPPIPAGEPTWVNFLGDSSGTPDGPVGSLSVAYPVL